MTRPFANQGHSTRGAALTRAGALLAALGAGVGLLAGCGEDCALYAVTGLRVRVVDCAGVAVCDASVSAAREGSDEVLRVPSGPACGYLGLEEQAGTYSVTAARGDVRSTPIEVTIVMGEVDGCPHVVPVERTIRLCGE